MIFQLTAAELKKRFDLPISIDTWRASVAQACFEVGACVGNDISGFADPDYLDVAAKASATVVATHIRLRPRVADPNPHYDDVTSSVHEFLLERRLRIEFLIPLALLDAQRQYHSRHLNLVRQFRLRSPALLRRLPLQRLRG